MYVTNGFLLQAVPLSISVFFLSFLLFIRWDLIVLVNSTVLCMKWGLLYPIVWITEEIHLKIALECSIMPKVNVYYLINSIIVHKITAALIKIT